MSQARLCLLAGCLIHITLLRTFPSAARSLSSRKPPLAVLFPVGQWPGACPRSGRPPGQVYLLLGPFDDEELGPHFPAGSEGAVAVLLGVGEGGTVSLEERPPPGMGQHRLAVGAGAAGLGLSLRCP